MTLRSIICISDLFSQRYVYICNKLISSGVRDPNNIFGKSVSFKLEYPYRIRGTHSGDYEDYALLKCDAVSSGR
jgi:hypothetical protein